uniref:CUB domain-containing protein 1 n=1 Tax=Neogobius melanostomus TaxID=47308 RepID=A0A8C6UAG2_9GOBI
PILFIPISILLMTSCILMSNVMHITGGSTTVLNCAKTSCSSDILKSEFSMFPDFNRTFIWDLKVVSTQAFQLDFPEPGMRQVPDKHTCPDEHTYSVITYLRTGPATIGTFCKGGTVSSVLVRYKGRMFLQVPGDRKLDPVDFKFSQGPQTEMAAILQVNLPRGLSNTTFITANYPVRFPDREAMQWVFVVPGMHNYTMSFTNYTLPECLNDGEDVVLEYHEADKKVTKFSLTDPQPKHQQGNFKMVLKNCATNKTLQGLTLNFNVSVMRSGHPVLCTVDLSKQQALSVQLEKVGSDSYCEMMIDSKHQEKIDVAPGSKASLSFLDCPNEDVQLTTTEVIGERECYNSSTCPDHMITVPKLDSCLPMPLHSATWRILMSQDSTVDLVSPTGSLSQALPGKECTGPVFLHVKETEGVSVGDYCFDGPIQKKQKRLSLCTGVTLSQTYIPLSILSLYLSTETIIYRVTPDPKATTLLGTPNWPQGMSPSSTVSWVVTLPQNYEALLHFPNVSQPKCADDHTSICVKMLGYEEELMSRREDEPIDKLTVPYSFYLNMSNCIPEGGTLGCSVVGLLLWKKKQKMSEASIYMAKGNIFRPNDRTFSKTRSDNESHVYASIDETMIYGHLLGDMSYADSLSDQYKGIQTESYHTFTGPTDGATLPTIQEPEAEPELDRSRRFLDASETFMPARPRTPIDRQDSLGFQDRRMMDNELYTFKTTGDFNTIRLSAADLQPQSPIDTVTEEEL